MEISVDEQLRISQLKLDNLELQMYLVRVDHTTNLERLETQRLTNEALERSQEMLQRALDYSRWENAKLANDYHCVIRQNQLEREISEVLRAHLDEVRRNPTYDVGSEVNGHPMLSENELPRPASTVADSP